MRILRHRCSGDQWRDSIKSAATAIGDAVVAADTHRGGSSDAFGTMTTMSPCPEFGRPEFGSTYGTIANVPGARFEDTLRFTLGTAAEVPGVPGEAVPAVLGGAAKADPVSWIGGASCARPDPGGPSPGGPGRLPELPFPPFGGGGGGAGDDFALFPPFGGGGSAGDDVALLLAGGGGAGDDVALLLALPSSELGAGAGMIDRTASAGFKEQLGLTTRQCNNKDDNKNVAAQHKLGNL